MANPIVFYEELYENLLEQVILVVNTVGKYHPFLFIFISYYFYDYGGGGDDYHYIIVVVMAIDCHSD